MIIENPKKETLLKIANLIEKKDLELAYKEISENFKKYKNSFFLYNMMGLVDAQNNKIEMAIHNYKEAIRINPKYIDAYNNLALTYYNLGKVNEAIENLQKSLEINEKFYIAHNNLAKIYFKKEDYEKSITYLKKSLNINPDYGDAINLLKEILCLNINFHKQESWLYQPIKNLITKYKIIQPTYISRSLISLFKQDNVTSNILKINFDNIEREKFINIIKDLQNFDLLLEFLKVCPLPDIELENFFRKIRKKILMIDINFKEYIEIKSFMISLSAQCILNEYIYSTSKEEIRKILEIENKIKHSLKNVEENLITVLSLYKNLSSYDLINDLNNNLLNEFLKNYLNEVKTEKDFKKTIKSIKKIDNIVSENVKQQYEENPYPRWKNPTITIPISVKNFFEINNIKTGKFDENDFKNPKILIAGCGTGQHAINTATCFKNSNVIALDLSFNSLAYAKRKSDEFEIKNISFVQGDILDINALDDQFDIIESVGVIHHMESPIEGLKCLLSVLKKNGFIKLGLYSELARRNIIQFQRRYPTDKINMTEEKIQYYRSQILNTSNEDDKSLMIFNDFYTMSDFRDMVFHVNEHNFNISKIKDMLKQVNLDFCGFSGFTTLSNSFINNLGKKFNRCDLNDWEKIELYEPDLFKGMYQFWSQKIF